MPPFAGVVLYPNTGKLDEKNNNRCGFRARISHCCVHQNRHDARGQRALGLTESAAGFDFGARTGSGARSCWARAIDVELVPVAHHNAPQRNYDDTKNKLGRKFRRIVVRYDGVIRGNLYQEKYEA